MHTCLATLSSVLMCSKYFIEQLEIMKPTYIIGTGNNCTKHWSLANVIFQNHLFVRFGKETLFEGICWRQQSENIIFLWICGELCKLVNFHTRQFMFSNEWKLTSIVVCSFSLEAFKK